MIEMGKKYTTRDGRAVRILCVDRQAYSNESVMALISEKGGENIYAFHSDGHFYPLGDSPLDLIPVPTKHEGWILVSKDGTIIGADVIYERIAIESQPFKGQTIHKIKWEDE